GPGAAARRRRRGRVRHRPGAAAAPPAAAGATAGHVVAQAGRLADQAVAEFGEGLARYERGEAEPALRHLRRAAALLGQARAAGARDAESLAIGGLVLSVLASCLGALSHGDEHRSRLAEAEALLAELRGIDPGKAAELAGQIASARG